MPTQFKRLPFSTMRSRRSDPPDPIQPSKDDIEWVDATVLNTVAVNYQTPSCCGKPMYIRSVDVLERRLPYSTTKTQIARRITVYCDRCLRERVHIRL